VRKFAKTLEQHFLKELSAARLFLWCEKIEKTVGHKNESIRKKGGWLEEKQDAGIEGWF